MAEAYQIKNFKFRKAINDYLNDIKSEATLEGRIERLKRLKQEAGEIYTSEFIYSNHIVLNDGNTPFFMGENT